MDKILILLPIWKREKITRLCLGNLSRLKKRYNIDVLCVVSERWAKRASFEYGFKYVEAPNECLGTKMNIGLKEAMKFNFDYLMNLGSDDLVTERLFEIYEPYFREQTPVFGSSKITFLDSTTKEAKDFDYKILVGAGRCIRRDILKIELEKGDIYDKIQVGLDNNSMKRFEKYVAKIVDNEFGTIIDVKSDVNIWSYDILPGEPVGFDVAIRNLEVKEVDAIIEL